MLFFALVATVVPPAIETPLNSEEYWSWIGIESEPSSLAEDNLVHDVSSGEEGSGPSSGDANDGSHKTMLWAYLMISGGSVILVFAVGWCFYWQWKRTVRDPSMLSQPIIDSNH